MLRDEEILELLSDGNISEIGSSRNESVDNDFPFAKFEHLLDNVDNENCLIEHDEEWVPPPLTITSKRNIRWAQKPFNQPTLKLDDVEQNNIILEIKSLYNTFLGIFLMIFSKNAIQKGVTRFKPTDMYEMKCLI